MYNYSTQANKTDRRSPEAMSLKKTEDNKGIVSQRYESKDLSDEATEMEGAKMKVSEQIEEEMLGALTGTS